MILWLVLTVTATLTSLAAQDPLAVKISVEPGPFYVGQLVALEVAVTSGNDRPAINPPTPQGARLVASGTSLEPLLTDSIGDIVNETIRYRYRYNLLLETPGSLLLPSFRLESPDHRRGATPALRLNVRQPSGSPKTHYGGVGHLTATARAEPNIVRAGQPFDYTLTLDGPGALGSRKSPDLSRLRDLPIGAEVRRLPDDEVLDPPSRTFRFQVRPQKAGEVSIPPIPISWLDPDTMRYETTLIPSVPVRVVAVPAFDPSSLVYPEAGSASSPIAPRRSPEKNQAATGSRSRAWTFDPRHILGLWLLILAAMMLAADWLSNRGKRQSASRVKRILRQTHSLNSFDSALPCTVSALLGEMIACLDHQGPPGELTPEEIREFVARTTGDESIATEAAALRRLCDHCRFSGNPADQNQRIQAMAFVLFPSLARAIPETRNRSPL